MRWVVGPAQHVIESRSEEWQRMPKSRLHRAGLFAALLRYSPVFRQWQEQR